MKSRKKAAFVVAYVLMLVSVPFSGYAAENLGEVVFQIPMNTYCSGSNVIDLSLELTNAKDTAANITLQLYKKDGSTLTTAGTAYDGVESTVVPGTPISLNGNASGVYHISYGGQLNNCNDRAYMGKIIVNSGTASILVSGWVDSRKGLLPIEVNNGQSVNLASPADITAPAAITNLAAGSPTSSSITLTWVAPGDDGSVGTATYYDIRYSTSPITEADWGSATQVSGEPTPGVAGTNESLVISNLSASTTYYFAIKTVDEIPNISALSNVVSATTSSNVSPNLIPEMTSNTSPSGKASASSIYNTAYDAWTALDSKIVNGMGWNTASGVTSAWIEYEFESPKVISKYVLTLDTTSNQTPKNWTFEAFNGTSWVVLDTRTNMTLSTLINYPGENEFIFENNQVYTRYRLNVSSVNGGGAIWMLRLQMMAKQ